MLVLISYDVAVSTPGGQKRLRHVAKACTDYGQRVQFSVFECSIPPDLWVKLKARLEKIIDRNLDSLRYYYLGSNYKNRIEHVGAKPAYDPEEPMIL